MNTPPHQILFTGLCWAISYWEMNAATNLTDFDQKSGSLSLSYQFINTSNGTDLLYQLHWSLLIKSISEEKYNF